MTRGKRKIRIIDSDVESDENGEVISIYPSGNVRLNKKKFKVIESEHIKGGYHIFKK